MTNDCNDVYYNTFIIYFILIIMIIVYYNLKQYRMLKNLKCLKNDFDKVLFEIKRIKNYDSNNLYF